MFSDHSSLVSSFVLEGLFNNFISRQDYKPKWTPIEPAVLYLDSNTDARPGMRGGHQMCIDTVTGKDYYPVMN